MPQPQSNDPDPLLSFAFESGVAAPLEPDTQPVVSAVVQPVVSDSTPPGLLLSRIEQLERALDESRSEVASLQSRVTTLVSAVGDFPKPVNPPPVTPPAPSRPRVSPSASAVAGVLIGISAAVLGWMVVSSGGDVTVGVPVASATQQAVPAVNRSEAVTALEPKQTDARSIESAKPLEPTKPLETPPTPKIARASQALQTTRYVGALSIDAEPGGEVFLNRESAGRTPLRLDNLRAGSHLIWIERDGYRRWTGVVQVPANRVSRLSAALEPIAVR